MSYQNTNSIKISLVEDDNIIREGFVMLLNENQGFKVVSAYNNCEDFLRNVQIDKPNVVLMDIELPGMNGIEGIERAKKIYPHAQIIVVTVYENDDLVFKALCAGAGGYLTKNMPSQRLVEAIREIMGGGAPMSTNIARLVVASFQKNHNSPLS